MLALVGFCFLLNHEFSICSNIAMFNRYPDVKIDPIYVPTSSPGGRVLRFGQDVPRVALIQFVYEGVIFPKIGTHIWGFF